MTHSQEQRILAKVKEELDGKLFCGYCGSSEFFQYTFKQFKDYCSGCLILAIGSGDWHNAVHNIVVQSAAYEAYHNARRARLEALGLEEG